MKTHLVDIFYQKVSDPVSLKSDALNISLKSYMFDSLSLIPFITASITTWAEYRAAKTAFTIERSPVLIVTGQLELAFSTVLPRQHPWTAWFGSHSNWFQSCIANISSQLYTYLSIGNTYQTVCVMMYFLSMNFFVEYMFYTNKIHIVIRIALNTNNTYLLWCFHRFCGNHMTTNMKSMGRIVLVGQYSIMYLLYIIHICVCVCVSVCT